jgi:predicted nucleic acid-binding protein
VSYLLDTNVISELRRKNPNPGVLAWMQHRPSATLFLSVLTLGEVRKGLEGIPDQQRRLALTDWLESELPIFFTGRILSVDVHVCDLWGRMVARAGRPLPAIDSLIAATAAFHDLVLVTRNVRDFEGLGVPLVNPWT